MTTIVLGNVPTALHRKLVRRAAKNKRSLGKEVIACLEEFLPKEGAASVKRESVKVLSARYEKLRSRFKGPPLTDEFLEEAINHGRA
jgi:plasmid stability protein